MIHRNTFLELKLLGRMLLELHGRLWQWQSKIVSIIWKRDGKNLSITVTGVYPASHDAVDHLVFEIHPIGVGSSI